MIGNVDESKIRALFCAMVARERRLTDVLDQGSSGLPEYTNAIDEATSIRLDLWYPGTEPDVMLALCSILLLSNVAADRSAPYRGMLARVLDDHRIANYPASDMEQFEMGTAIGRYKWAAGDLIVKAVAEGLEGTGEWRRQFLERVLAEGYRPDYVEVAVLKSAEFRCNELAIHLADYSMEKIRTSGRGRQLLRLGKVEEWTNRFENHTAIFVVRPRYMFEVLGMVPPSKRCNVGYLDRHDVLSLARSEDAKAVGWLDLLLDSNLAGWRDWAMRHATGLSNEELAQISSKGDGDVRRWAIEQAGRQWAKDNGAPIHPRRQV